MKAYRDRPAQRKEARQATVEGRVDEDALESAVRRLGWRVSGTHQPRACLSLEQAVLAYRNAYLVERSVGRLTGRPLSLRPMDVQRADHATGLIRLWSMGVRVLTLVECVARRQLAAAGGKLSGLYAGNAKRETARPTAERLLEALQDVTVTVMQGAHETYRHLTVLGPLQERILEILGFSAEVYTRLCPVSAEPP
jgi:transposase